ncbi:MAG TPA: glycosyltransferase family A protein [Thermoleophilaceae bacterium]
MNVSVVIRARNEAESIGHTIDLLQRQTIGSELIVVDSGSTDATVEIARLRGAQVIEIPAATFTFGGSLNTGTEAASAPIVVALSAHAFPKHDRWLEAMAGAFDEPKVACAVGGEHHPDGGQIDGRLEQDAELARHHPWSGYSNAAGGFRRDLWEQYPFRTDMPGTEDKEWAWHWLQQGYICVIAPELKVEHDHTKDPLRDTWSRARREWIGYGMYMDLEPYPARAAFRDFRDAARQYRHPLNIAREAVRVGGEWSVRHKGGRR